MSEEALETSYKISYPDGKDNELILRGSEEQAKAAVAAFAGTSYIPLAKAAVGPIDKTATIIIKGTSEELIAALRILYKAELIECDHEFTETVDVDDDRWIGADSELHERSNPDATRCLICGKYYYPETEEWEER